MLCLSPRVCLFSTLLEFQSALQSGPLKLHCIKYTQCILFHLFASTQYCKILKLFLIWNGGVLAKFEA